VRNKLFNIADLFITIGEIPPIVENPIFEPAPWIYCPDKIS
jgi:lipoprotein signal peptidase